MSQTKDQYQFDSLTVEKCFESFYVVPDYQREYVWKAENHVTKLLQDIYDAFTNDSSKEYFLGTTVVIEDKGIYELIDGQQRTTTLYLILCAFKEIYKLHGLSTQVLDRKIADIMLDEQGNEVHQYRLVLQYENTTDYLQKIVKNEIGPEENLTNSNFRLFEAYETAKTFINDQTHNDVNELKSFFMYFFKKLKFIQIQAPYISEALKIFETINARGAGLNSVDLLKNLIFRQVKREEFDKLKSKWKEFIAILEDADEKPLRFLRYFIVSNYPSLHNNPTKQENTMREDDIYNWISQNADKCKYNENPFAFVELLTENAKCYVNFTKGRDAQGNNNQHLVNIIYLAGSAFRQHIILLLTARKFPQDMFNYLVKNLETYLFYFLFTKEQAKIYEKQFGLWNTYLKDVTNMEQLTDFVQNRIKPEIDKKETEFKARFYSFSECDLQLYRVRYILAKLSMYIDMMHNGSQITPDISKYAKYEIEHILPKTPTPQILATLPEDVQYSQLKSMLGNLTLLEQPLNGSIHNNLFEEKKSAFASSNLYLTRSLVKLDNVGVNNAVTRTNQLLLEFDHWDDKTIAERQEMLYKIALKIWKIS